MNRREIDDRYAECIYARRLTPPSSSSGNPNRSGVYTFIEVDDNKGSRVSAVDSVTPKIIRDMRLDNSLDTQHLEALV